MPVIDWNAILPLILAAVAGLIAPRFPVLGPIIIKLLNSLLGPAPVTPAPGPNPAPGPTPLVPVLPVAPSTGRPVLDLLAKLLPSLLPLLFKARTSPESLNQEEKELVALVYHATPDSDPLTPHVK